MCGEYVYAQIKRIILKIQFWLTAQTLCNCVWIFLGSHILFAVILIVMAMESEAEALGQLTSDDLEGKVVNAVYYATFLFYIRMICWAWDRNSIKQKKTCASFL